MAGAGTVRSSHGAAGDGADDDHLHEASCMRLTIRVNWNSSIVPPSTTPTAFMIAR